MGIFLKNNEGSTKLWGQKVFCRVNIVKTNVGGKSGNKIVKPTTFRLIIIKKTSIPGGGEM